MKNLKIWVLGLLCIGSSLSASTAFAGDSQDCANNNATFGAYKNCLKDRYKARGLSESSAVAMSERASNLDYCAMRMQLPDRIPVAPSNNLYPVYQSCMAGGPVPDAQTTAAANQPNSCDAACRLAEDNTKFSTGDAKCDRDPACRECALAKMGSQLGSYCSAKNITKKAKTNQTISAAIFGVVGGICALGCAGVTAAYVQSACTIGGFVTLGTELILAKSASQLDSYSQGWVQSTTKMATPVVQSLQALKVLQAAQAAKTIAGTVSKLGAQTKGTLSCAAGVIYLAQASLKVASIIKFKKSTSKNCDDIEKFLQPSNASPMVAECKANTVIPKGFEGAKGGASSVPKSFNIQDPEVAQLIDDPNVKDFVNELSKDPKMLAEANKIGQKIMDDESLEGVIADMGGKYPSLPEGLMEITDRVKNGETLTALNMTGEDTKAMLIAGENKGNESGNGISSELKFGGLGGNNVAVPQEGADAMEVGRSPASTGLKFSSNDPFHAGDPRDLFRIASDQIKNQYGKKNVQSLAPESRMNRMLSGMRTGNAADQEAK